jgi:hypothetical protein
VYFKYLLECPIVLNVAIVSNASWFVSAPYEFIVSRHRFNGTFMGFVHFVILFSFVFINYFYYVAVVHCCM